MNEVFCEQIRHKKEVGGIRSEVFFQKMSSGNILSEFFQRLPMGIKDKGFGG